MTPPPPPEPPPPDLLEQARLALLRGHLGQARALLDRLVAVEPGNAPAQDLRAQVVAKQAALAETRRLQAGGYGAGGAPARGYGAGGAPARGYGAGGAPARGYGAGGYPGPAGPLWTRPVRGGGPLVSFIVAVVLGAATHAGRVWPDPQNERVAESLVGSAYQTAMRGGEQQYDHRQWEALEGRYGRVLAWHITAEHRTLLRGDWEFQVDVTRERAVTRERVEAMAGPSEAYGYYSSITDVRAESAAARR